MEKFNQLKVLIASLEDDVYKCFYRLNGAAGKRVRKAMQQVKILSQEIRVEIQEIKKDQQDNSEK